jgi:hypothetical protein
VPVRLLGLLGLAGCGLALVTVGLLHVATADTVDPTRRTISEYGLGARGWVFDLGVLGLAAGSAAVLLALVGAGVLRTRSPAAVLVSTWVLALVAVVVFEKANWSVGPSLSGYVHRYASLVAFVCLPVAALGIARPWRRDPAWGRFAGWTRGLGVAALLWLAALLLTVPLGGLLGVPWWQVLPLGLVERGLALTGVGAVVAMALWAHRATARRRAHGHPPGDAERITA